MTGPLISRHNSMVLKGVGILLMLIHHLFYSQESRELYNDIIIHGVGVVNRIGIFSKMCVSLFVFVSGYGLAVSTAENINLKSFYWHRFKKLYLNYWYIWLLFVPVSVFVYGRTFTEAYGDQVVVKGFLDFLGLLKMFGYDSYNPTWWFYNCIIVLYLLFPLLNKCLLGSSYFLLSIAMSLLVIGFVPGVNVIAVYLLPFLTGMFLARMPVHWIESTKIWHLFISIMFLSIWRLDVGCPKHIIESMLCMGFAILLYKVSIWKWLGNVMEELGKHSMNMFLIHTFFFYFWFREYIYITRNPLLIFVSLLTISYVASVVLEKIKQTVGFYKLLNNGKR